MRSSGLRGGRSGGVRRGTGAGHGSGRREFEPLVHVEPESIVRADVGRPLGQDLLEQQRVHMVKAGLEQVQREHGGLGVLLVRARQVAILAVVRHGVCAVPGVHGLELAVDLPPHAGAGEIVAREDGADGPAEFFEGGIGGVPMPSMATPAQAGEFTQMTARSEPSGALLGLVPLAVPRLRLPARPLHVVRSGRTLLPRFDIRCMPFG